MEEFIIVLKWYLVFLGLGIIGLGFTQKIFKDWHDQGYGLAKFVGLAIVALPLWFFASLKLIPFNEISVTVIFLITFAIAVLLLWKEKFKFNKFILIYELIFLILFTLWTAIRSTNSQIEGTEKFMNLAFMNSINRSEFFAPNDPWYQGSAINYYYLGHYLFVFLGKFAGIAMSYVYNLALTTIISYAFIAAMSLVNELTGLGKKSWKLAILAGIFAGSWLCFGSNLHYLYSWVEQVVINGKEFAYWFPDGTRIIPHVIDEFPAYSIALGDLHGHYLGMPFELLFIGLLFASFQTALNSSKKIYLNLAISFLLVAMYGINTWDFISLNFAFFLLHFYQFINLKGLWGDKLISLITAQTVLLIPGIILMLPYFVSFIPAVSGIGLVPLLTERDVIAYLQMWGMFLLISVLGLITLFFLLRKQKLGFSKWYRNLIKENHTGIFVFILNIVAIALILGVEIFYVRDIFERDNGAYFRTNTVFKFYFIAWSIWSIVCSYYVVEIIKGIFNTPWKYAYILLFANIILIAIAYLGSVAYIFEAVDDFYSFAKFTDGKKIKISEIINGKEVKLWDSIDGNTYIKRLHPEDYAVIKYINENIKGQPVIAEAVGDAYTYYTRISTNTGLVTVVGWPTHEWQWRDLVTEIYARKDEVQKLYTTRDMNEFVTILKKFKIQYIVVGDKERESYADLNEDLIRQLGTEVVTEGSTTLYAMPQVTP